jgi:hypothetical protein
MWGMEAYLIAIVYYKHLLPDRNRTIHHILIISALPIMIVPTTAMRDKRPV